MNNSKKATLPTILLGLLLPLLLSALFYLLRGQRAIMDGWVQVMLTPIAQTLGKICSIFPFSVGEVLIFAAVLFLEVTLIWGIVVAIRSKRWQPLRTAIIRMSVVGLWVFALLNWMWNVTYYSTGFAERSGLDTAPYSVEELALTTIYFAEQAAITSQEIPRTDDLHFDVTRADCLSRSDGIYDSLEEEFPFLQMDDRRAKPFFFSRIQSWMGFTGMYMPFTGEANVNADAPLCLFPVTIAHELSHQRLIASEDEANFLGITASVTSDDPVYQYSGYLLGLMELSSALSAVAPDVWRAIWDYYVTDELYTDWGDNYDYWQQFESPVDDVVTQAYDGYLKGNDQPLGMQSYGACVDLLVAYFTK